jgi:hypothetical protein
MGDSLSNHEAADVGSVCLLSVRFYSFANDVAIVVELLGKIVAHYTLVFNSKTAAQPTVRKTRRKILKKTLHVGTSICFWPMWSPLSSQADLV